MNTCSNTRNNNVAVPRVPGTTTNNNNRRQNRTSNNRQSTTTTSTSNLAPRVQPPQQRNHRQPRVVPAISQTTQQRPRVRMAPINKETQIYPIGTTIRKKFNNFNHFGQVIKYDEENEWYTIEYQDGN